MYFERSAARSISGAAWGQGAGLSPRRVGLRSAREHPQVTEDVIRTGGFASVGELVRDIDAYLAQRNANPRPYTWKAEGAAILEKIKRARAVLEKAQAA